MSARESLLERKRLPRGRRFFFGGLLVDKWAQKYHRTMVCEGMGLQFLCADMASLGNFMMAFR